jgi:hypothetical protein
MIDVDEVEFNYLEKELLELKGKVQYNYEEHMIDPAYSFFQ